MFSINGVGIRLYGRKNKDTEGWYTATKFFCVFWFPIIPLACYRVKKIFGHGNFLFGHSTYEMYQTKTDNIQTMLVYAAFYIPAFVVFILINIFEIS